MYDPNIHHRHSIRLRGYDYENPRAYFITICIQDDNCLLGQVVNCEMNLNAFGRLVENQWKKLPRFFRHVSLDVFQFMPNHMHGIIILHKRPETTNVDQQANRKQWGGTIPGSISAIVQNYCSSTTTKINNIRYTPGLKFWQRGYYDHIIRNEREFQRIRQYIIANPSRWRDDINYR